MAARSSSRREPALATVVVVTWNGAHLLAPCLTALRAQEDGPPFCTWVVDNASTDGTRELLGERFPEVRLLSNPANLGFGGGCNRALREIDTPYAVLLNNDATPRPNWLHELLGPLEGPGSVDVAAVTSKVLLARDGRLNNTGLVLRRDGYGVDRGFGEPDDGRYDTPVEVFGFSGTAVALRMAALADVGVFDDAFFTYYEDADLSWRLRLAGWRIRYCPAAVVNHQHGASSDLRSASFAFFNERNRLLTLTKAAPASLALAQVARFPVTTALIAARRLRGVPRPPGHHLSTLLRLRVLGSYLGLLPRTLRLRADIGRRARVPRREVGALLEPPPARRRAPTGS